MKMEIVVLGKNFWEMPNGQSGANLVLLGDFEETNNKIGISVSEGKIDFDEHYKVTEFPARYQADVNIVSQKSRSGKNVTSLEFKNLEFIEKVEFVSKKKAK